MTDFTAVCEEARDRYRGTMERLRAVFLQDRRSGPEVVRQRTDAVDRLVSALWESLTAEAGTVHTNQVAIVAVGGYGRQECFPFSDIDLLFLVANEAGEQSAQAALRRLSKALWDSGVRVAATTRQLSECARLHADNAEFSLALLDARAVCGDSALAQRLQEETLPQLLAKDGVALTTHLLELTRARHAKFGNTLFHLEPNIKECPGGLRDRNVCDWLARLTNGAPPAGNELREASAFLTSLRCFLHFRIGRDTNILEWRTQDAAAAEDVGGPGTQPRDPANWMQLYFRHARTVARALDQQTERVPDRGVLPSLTQLLRRALPEPSGGFTIRQGRIRLTAQDTASDPAEDADTAIQVFQLMAKTGLRLDLQSASRLENRLPLLSQELAGGAVLWQQLQPILAERYAGLALRTMHELGVLELVLPEFHGIDALVIRDAYHRYTVDEHTFVVIDNLHGLPDVKTGPMAEWAVKFAAVLHELQHPVLLYLAALLHDTGKGRATGNHAEESATLAAGVLARLQMDEYSTRLVLTLIRNHLEMSAALRRDIFDAETVRTFAHKVQSPEELRMLALFTFADIQAVHPDALTPWKAENLWRLFIATANYLDRNMDEERVDTRVSSDLVLRVTQSLPDESREVLQFLEGFPQRYLQTRSPEQIRTQYRMGRQLAQDPVQLNFVWRKDLSELTLVTPDRQLLFSRIVGVLAAWGMNIVTADAFSNARGTVVDSFRFTDSFGTLEKNPSERDRLLQDVHDAIADAALAERLLAGRKRSRRRGPLLDIETSVHFDTESSTHSTLLQVAAQDVPGLLYSISVVLAQAACDIRVAVIDTEGETAIDVFYLTHEGKPLEPGMLPALQQQLLTAIEQNAV